ncbi:MAG: protein BatD [Bergeyella sp.]|nr:protein BatD [Bergeyella sp.]
MSILKFFFSFFSSLICAQVSLDLSSDKARYLPGEGVDLILSLEIKGNDQERETPIMLPDFSNFSVRGSGASKNFCLDSQTQEKKIRIISHFRLQPKKKGKIKIGSALVRVSGKTYKTEPFYIVVSERLSLGSPPSPQKNAPEIMVDIEVKPTEVFLEEPVIATVKAYSRDFNHLLKISDIDFSSQETMEVYPISLKRSVIKEDTATDLSSQILGVFMLVPKSLGTVRIPEAVVRLNRSGIKLRTQKKYLKVKKLPDEKPAGYKNAVGNFEIKLKKIKTNKPLHINEPVELKVSVRGSGNLNASILPDLKTSSPCDIYAPDVKKKIDTENSKTKGYIEAHYIIVPKTKGNLVINTSDFSFFDPVKARYVSLGKKYLGLKVQGNLQGLPVSGDKAGSQGVFYEKSYSRKNTSQKGFFYSQPFFVGLFFVSLFFLGGGIFWKNKRNKRKNIPANYPSESTEEIEKQVKKDHFVVQKALEKLEKKLKSGEYKEYFEEFGEFVTNFENHCSLLSPKEKLYKGGSDFSERYENLVKKINRQKYAPYPEKERLENYQKELKFLILDSV